MFRKLGLSIVMFQLASGCSSPQAENSKLTPATPASVAIAPPPSSSSAITIMTYNVENLFDTKHDKNKEDFTSLPLKAKQTKKHKKFCNTISREEWRRQCLDWDWSEETLKTKLERLAKVIRSVRSGKGPDILFLQEVENLSVLKRLNEEYLKDLNYQPILLEGSDLRGIDVAILSRLPRLGPPELLTIPFKKTKKKILQDTRGILRAKFRLPNQKTLVAHVVHLPAPFHPTELRVQALNYLNSLVEQKQPGHVYVAAGDFNITREEDDAKKILELYTHPQWLAAHQMGCQSCKGSYYYSPKDSWSFLDMILLSKDFYDGLNGWRVDTKSIRLVNQGHSEQVNSQQQPKGFDVPTRAGVSDHWPIALEIVPTN